MKDLVNTNGEDCLDNLLRFAEDIRFLNYDLNLSVAELTSSKFMYGLSMVSWGRYNFANALSSLSTTYQSTTFAPVISYAMQCHKQWELLKSYIIKCFLTKKLDLYQDKIATLLPLILNTESDILKGISDLP